MSKTIDQRVVEMQFDNKDFERNVSTTMSTLDKLKRSLHMDGATKGLENVNTAAKKVDMSGLANGVESVRLRFSALDIMGATVFANLANSAYQAGKRIMSALTIDPVKTGFQEYETQINATQTILANTASKGSSIEDVNKALEELNKYADLTIYNFTEMTRNIGTFTAAGIDLDTSVNAIQGIANLAAVSGSTSQQASTAMYQLSQALAAGTVRLMDWNSVVNAGMGGEMFQKALRETSELLGTGAEAAIEAEGSFRESLRMGWLTSDVLTQTLKKFTATGANERVAEYTGLSKEAVEAALAEAEAMYGEADAIAYASKVLAEKSGKNADEIEATLQFAKNAQDAATKVKTFTQLWDVMKESAQSGWAQTWKILVGDFEEAKSLITPIADFMTGVLNKMSDARNKLLESAMSKGFTKMMRGFGSILSTTQNGIDKVLAPVDALEGALDTATGAIEDFGDIVDKVILGSFGNGKDRFDALTEAGYNYYRIQNKVNEKLGDSFRHSEDVIAAQDELLGIQKRSTNAKIDEKNATTELTAIDRRRLENLTRLSDEQLRSKGCTEDQIAALRELEATADKLGLSVDYFLEHLDEINGRWLLINSFKNIGQSIVTIFRSMADAWNEIFDPITPDIIFNIVAGLHKLSTYLKVDTDAAENFKRTFKGVFAALDIVLTVVGGPLKIAFKAFTQLLGMFNLDILEFTALVGDAIVGFRDWIDESLDFTKVFEIIIPIIESCVNVLKGWYETIKESGIVQDVIQGFIDGLKDGATKVWNAAAEFVTNLITAAKETLGIHSPSKVFFEIGHYVVQGLVNGIRAGIHWVIDSAVTLCTTLMDAVRSVDLSSLGESAGELWKGFTTGIKTASGNASEFISGILEKIKKVFGGINIGDLIAGTVSGGMLVLFVKIGKAVESLTKPFAAIGDILDGFKDIGGAVTKTVKSFSKVIKGYAMTLNAKALKDIAIAIAILVGSIALLTLLDPTKLETAIEVLFTVSIALAAVAAILSKFGSVSDGVKGSLKGMVNIAKVAGLIMAIGVSMLMLAGVLKILAGMTGDELTKAGIGLFGLGILVAGLISATKMAGEDIDKVGGMILKVGIAMLLLTGVAKIIAGMTWDELGKAGAGLAGLTILVGGLIAVSKLAGNDISKVGGTIFKVGLAMLMLIGVAKIISGMTWDELGKAGAGLAGLTILIGGLITVTKLAGSNIDKVGGTIFKIGAAMALLAVVAKIIAGMSWGDLAKAEVGLAGLALIISGLVYATKFAGEKELKRVGTTLLMMSISIGILAAVATILGFVDLKHLAKGVTAVGILGLIMAAMVAATRGANDCKGNILWMTVAIVAMAASAVALSLIDTKKLAGATAAMSAMMLSFALMTKAAGTSKGSIASLLIITAAVGLFAVILYKLAELPIEATLGSAAALSMMILSLSGAMVLLSIAGSNAAGAFMGVLALTAMAVPLIAFVGILALMNKIENATTNALLLAGMMTAMTLMLIPLTLIGAAGPAAFVGIGALAAFIIAIGGLVVGIGALMDKFPVLEEFLAKGIDILEELSFGLGSVIGNFAGGILDGLTSNLPKIGEDLSAFMEKATPFIEGAKNIKSETLDGVKNLVDIITSITKASLLESITAWITGGSSMQKFGEELVPFGKAITAFSAEVEGINESAVTAAASAGKMLAEMAAAIPNAGGIAGFFAGENDVVAFGEDLVSFGESMAAFSSTVAGRIDEAAVTAAANAGKVLVELANSIPNAGGVAGFFTGENDIDTFGTKLVSFGRSITSFSKTVAGNIDETAITAAANAGKIMLELAASLPNTGGVVGFFAGDNDLDTFGTQIVAFGESMAAFSDTVRGSVDHEAVGAATSAGLMLAALADSLPKSGGFGSLFAADNDMSTFGKELEEFGESMTAYSDAIADANFVRIKASIIHFGNIVEMARSASGVDFTSFGEFATALKKLGNAGIDKFVSAFEDADTKVNQAITAMMRDVTDGLASRTPALETSFAKLAADLITRFVESCKGFRRVGSELALEIARGMTDNSQKLKDDADRMIAGIVQVLQDRHSSFFSAGTYLAVGFANGIAASSFMATVNARAMANAAVEAAREALDINSPSRVTYGLGMSYGEGFVKAIDDYALIAYRAGSDMTQSARNGLKDAIGKVRDFISSDIDVTPTIRPVLDLSDAESKASALSSMFSDSAVSVNANVGAISTMMNRRSQNGTNADVVTAIDRLNKRFDSIGNTTYQVNGITYDDGSNISDAVRTLVRAVKIEGRV